MKKFNLAILLALAFAVLGGCANMPGAMVGTSATTADAYPYMPEAIPRQLWTNDD